MKNKNLLIIGGVFLLLAVFSGCGDRSGEKEYNKAMASWKSGDLVRAQGQLEKALRKLSGNEKKSVANNQLGLILWALGKPEQAIEKFGESCRLAEHLTGANENLGVALYHADELDQAEFEFTKILSENPSNPAACSFMGLIQMQRKDWKGASKELSTGLRANPDNPAGQNALALAELHLNRSSDAAVKRLKQVVAAYPKYAPAAYNLAVIHDQWLDNKSAALGWYKQYLQKTGGQGLHEEYARQAIARLGGKAPKTESATPPKRTYPEAAAKYADQGSKLHAAKKYSEAVADYEKAIQADPSLKTAHYNMGLSYYALEKYPEAARSCASALKIDPGFANARYMLALAYSQQRKWTDAEREAKALKQVDAARGESMLEYISNVRKR